MPKAKFSDFNTPELPVKKRRLRRREETVEKDKPAPHSNSIEDPKQQGNVGGWGPTLFLSPKKTKSKKTNSKKTNSKKTNRKKRKIDPKYERPYYYIVMTLLREMIKEKRMTSHNRESLRKIIRQGLRAKKLDENDTINTANNILAKVAKVDDNYFFQVTEEEDEEKFCSINPECDPSNLSSHNTRHWTPEQKIDFAKTFNEAMSCIKQETQNKSSSDKKSVSSDGSYHFSESVAQNNECIKEQNTQTRSGTTDKISWSPTLLRSWSPTPPRFISQLFPNPGRHFKWPFSDQGATNSSDKNDENKDKDDENKDDSKTKDNWWGWRG